MEQVSCKNKRNETPLTCNFSSDAYFLKKNQGTKTVTYNKEVNTYPNFSTNICREQEDSERPPYAVHLCSIKQETAS